MRNFPTFLGMRWRWILAFHFAVHRKTVSFTANSHPQILFVFFLNSASVTSSLPLSFPSCGSPWLPPPGVMACHGPVPRRLCAFLYFLLVNCFRIYEFLSFIYIYIYLYTFFFFYPSAKWLIVSLRNERLILPEWFHLSVISIDVWFIWIQSFESDGWCHYRKTEANVLESRSNDWHQAPHWIQTRISDPKRRGAIRSEKKWPLQMGTYRLIAIKS